jgi:hypothetical protein
MNGGRWGLEGPPPEAYSRVTNPERFAPLHPFALSHLQRLQEQFAVDRVEDYEPVRGLTQADLARATVKLIPSDSRAAPIVVAFTKFPSLLLRCGLLVELGFPSCGCDACDATAEGEQEQLKLVMDAVVKGRFRESIRVPLWGEAQVNWEFQSNGNRMGGGERISRSRARAVVTWRNRSIDWASWPLK